MGKLKKVTSFAIAGLSFNVLNAESELILAVYANSLFPWGILKTLLMCTCPLGLFGGVVFLSFPCCSKVSLGLYRVQCPLKVWILELASNNNFSCRALVQQVLVSRNILLQVNTLNIV